MVYTKTKPYYLFQFGSVRFGFTILNRPNLNNRLTVKPKILANAVIPPSLYHWHTHIIYIIYSVLYGYG